MNKQVSARKAYGEALAKYGKVDPNIVVLVADVSSSVQTNYFAKAFPERFFNIGIAEQGMVDIAVGFALGGMIPFINTFAGLFLRAIEQIRTCVAYAETNVKLIGGYAGLSDFKDGPTHHSITDIAIMRAIPNMTVIVPADATEIRKMVPAIAEYPGPVYLRISRAEMPLIFDDSHQVKIGNGVMVRDGTDISIIANGSMLARSLEAGKVMAAEGINARIINMHTVKPLDISLIKRCAKETGAIVTVEEHSIVGGLGSAVAEILVKEHPVPIEMVGIADKFTETALDSDSLLDHYGMGVDDIVKAVQQVLRRREK